MISQMTKVLVIGSNSFSGSDFIDLLLEEQRFQVVGISRSPEKAPLFLPYRQRVGAPFQFHQIDLNTDFPRLIDLMDTVQPEYVVNFAAQSEVAPSWEHPDQWFQTNAVAVTRLANVLKDRKFLKRYLHISSPEVYGTCVGRICEDAPLNPSTPYAASKAAGDLSLFTFAKHRHFPLVMIRSTNVYGAHQQLFKIIPRTAIYIKLGKKVELHGGGRAIKSYIHIRDVSHGELAVMERGRVGELYHLSPDEGVAVQSVVKMICQRMGVPFAQVSTSVGERLGQDATYVIDSTKARNEFGWRPTVDLATGVGKVVEWVQSHFKEISELPLHYIHKP